MAKIRTVLGDIAPEEAGVTLTHEHIRYAYPGCEYDHKNLWDFDEAAADMRVEPGDKILVARIVFEAKHGNRSRDPRGLVGRRARASRSPEAKRKPDRRRTRPEAFS